MSTKPREPRLLVEDLPAEHLAELEYLWDRRASLVRSYEQFPHHLADVDRRMEANAIGLEVAARPALPLLEDALGADEPSLVAAAAWASLRIGGERATAAVLGALEAGSPAAREGVRQALVTGPAAALLDRVRGLASAPDAALAATAAEVLAAHGGGAPRELASWLAHPDAIVRLAACRVAAWTATAAEKLEPLARADGDASVREAAYEAAVWQRAPWVLALGRESARAKVPTPPDGVLAMFCAIAEPADAPLVAAIGAEPALGPGRWNCLAAYGSVASIEACLAGLSGADAADAEAAGRAFVRMTGFELGAAKRVALAAPADAGPDAAEFADEAFVADPEVAKKRWESGRKEFATGRRWSRGRDVDGSGTAAIADIDLGARAEAMRRGRYRATWNGSRRESFQLR